MTVVAGTTGLEALSLLLLDPVRVVLRVDREREKRMLLVLLSLLA